MGTGKGMTSGWLSQWGYAFATQPIHLNGRYAFEFKEYALYSNKSSINRSLFISGIPIITQML